jgi:rhodanese-related sulfurtransferase
MDTITARTLKPLLTSGTEIAFIDVREAGQHGEGHPFFSINVPYSRLEIEIEALVPRRTTDIVLLDEADGVAERAARRLAGLGYTSVRALADGAAGWAAAGYTLFKGVNVPSKAFGEIVEHDLGTPSLSAEEFKARVDAGERLVVLDGRTPAEYRRMTIPGSKSMPNAELPHRIAELVDDDTTPIVINCAGRTRSIIGAQNLRNIGIRNPVIALRNGTQGWLLAGYELEHGSRPTPLPAVSAATAELSRKRGAELIARYKLPVASIDDLTRWQADARRSTYLLDVRSHEEYAAGHMPGAGHAPGGQLVQATDQWVGVRGARIVLSDDTGLRAATTAYWLRGMGHDAIVLGVDVTGLPGLVPGASVARAPAPGLPRLPPATALRLVREGATLIDVGPGMSYRKGHLAGARWGTRARLDRLGLPSASTVVLVAPEPETAELAAQDLAELGVRVAGLAIASEEAWRAAGAEIVATPSVPSKDECIDYLFFVHDRHDGNLDAARGYLAWEVGLLAQMDAQETGVLRPLR